MKTKARQTALLCAIFVVFSVLHLAADTATVDGITWTYTVSNSEASLGGGSSSQTAVPTSTSGGIADRKSVV